MEYVLFTMIYLLIFFLKGCLYYKVENRKILACVYVVDIIVTFYKFLLFPLSVFILKFENDFSIFKLLKKYNLKKLTAMYCTSNLVSKILGSVHTDILWIIFYNILIFIDSKIY